MKKQKQVFQPDDRIFRKMMEDKENVKAYLEHFFPKIAQIADLNSLRQENTSSLLPDLKLFLSDIIYRCRFRGSEKKHFYFSLLFEHKSAPDKHVAIQVGLYVMLMMHRMSRLNGQEIEPVVPLVFYNGKDAWKPQTLKQLFEKHPHFEKLQTYIPDFTFLFKDIAREPIERLLDIQLSYFRSLILSMALKHQPDLILNYITVIFDLKDKEQLRSAVVYFLAVIERSPREFMDELKNIEFTTKAETMSTLEMLLEQGRQEGLEIGIQKGIKEGLEKGIKEGQKKERVLNLLKLRLNFPKLLPGQLSEFTGISLKKVNQFYDIINSEDLEEGISFVREELLVDIRLSEEEWALYQQLIVNIYSGIE